jgi:hypothetical protein
MRGTLIDDPRSKPHTKSMIATHPRKSTIFLKFFNTIPDLVAPNFFQEKSKAYQAFKETAILIQAI